MNPSQTSSECDQQSPGLRFSLELVRMIAERRVHQLLGHQMLPYTFPINYVDIGSMSSQ